MASLAQHVLALDEQSQEEKEDVERQQRQDHRSTMLAVLFGFYTVSLLLFFVVGCLLVVSQLGVDVFSRLPRVIRPATARTTSRYQSF